MSPSTPSSSSSSSFRTPLFPLCAHPNIITPLRHKPSLQSFFPSFQSTLPNEPAPGPSLQVLTSNIHRPITPTLPTPLPLPPLPLPPRSSLLTPSHSHLNNTFQSTSTVILVEKGLISAIREHGSKAHVPHLLDPIAERDSLSTLDGALSVAKDEEEEEEEEERSGIGEERSGIGEWNEKGDGRRLGTGLTKAGVEGWEWEWEEMKRGEGMQREGKRGVRIVVEGEEGGMGWRGDGVEKKMKKKKEKGDRMEGEKEIVEKKVLDGRIKKMDDVLRRRRVKKRVKGLEEKVDEELNDETDEKGGRGRKEGQQWWDKLCEKMSLMCCGMEKGR